MDKSLMRIRIPTTMKTWLAARAAENGRSMNSEIVQILKRAEKPDSEMAKPS